jgi:Zn-dependent M28 family amino/carboxypeptidase
MKKIAEFDVKILLFCCTALAVLGLTWVSGERKTTFDAQSAFQYLARLQSNGPRVPGSAAHDKAVDLITSTLMENGWMVEVQAGSVNDHPYRNIIGRKGPLPANLLLGSHYDSRLVADHDPDLRRQKDAVQGANDGGSSTAVLLELSRILPDELSVNVELVFFDIEDQGHINGWDWILGSKEFVKRNPRQPGMMVLLDMVGGHDQTIQPPVNSNPDIYKKIQRTAIRYGYGTHFLNPSKSGILDDHVPFLEAGVPSVDLIDIIDPGWHTATDDLENVNLFSLQRLGDTLTGWISDSYGKSGY